MPSLYKSFNFEPSKGAKRLWRFTRKQSKPIGNLKIPGLFQTEYFFWDTIGFIGVLVFEAFGAFKLYAVRPYSFIGAILAFIVADFLFAFFGHWKRGIICEESNRYIIEDNHIRKTKINQKINKLKLFSYLFKVLIIFIAFIKIFFFWEAYHFRTDEPVIFSVFSIYILVCLLHIFCTGNFISELITSFTFYWQKQDLISKGQTSNFYIKNYHIIMFTSPIELKIVEIDSVGGQKHKLTKSNDNYEIKAWGILSDDDIDNFVNNQDNTFQREILAQKLIELQLQILNTNPLN